MKNTPQPIEFTPIKLDVNFEAYKKAVDNGEAKIKNFSEALEWCYNNYVDDKDLNASARPSLRTTRRQLGTAPRRTGPPP